MRCSRCQKLISDWLDGNLSQQDSKRLGAHLKKCPGCNEYFEALKVIDREVRRLPEVEIGDITEFEASLRRELNQIDQQKLITKRKRWFKIPVPAWGIGLVFLAAAIYLLFYFRPGPAENGQIELATLLSYEDSYLTLTQTIATDEDVMESLNQEIINSIIQETLAWEPDESDYSEIYHKQINVINIDEYLLQQEDNMGFQEGK